MKTAGEGGGEAVLYICPGIGVINSRCLCRRIHGLQQCLLREMSIPLSRLQLAVPEDLGNLIYGPSGIDHIAGHTVPQIMHPYIWQSGSDPGIVPGAVYLDMRLQGIRIGNQIRSTRQTVAASE